LPTTHAAVVFDGRIFGMLLPRALPGRLPTPGCADRHVALQIEFNQSDGRGFRFVGARAPSISHRRQVARARPRACLRAERSRMILVAGIPDERPLALVIEALEASGADHRVLDQRRTAESDLTLEIADAARGGAIGGMLDVDGERYRSRRLPAIYLRLMDHRFLPGFADSPPTPNPGCTAAASMSCCTASPISHRLAC
jgi:hypothetical protein